MKKIAFVMPVLGMGGAERVVSTIIRYIDKEEFDSYLLLFKGEGDYEKTLPKNIRIIVLGQNTLAKNCYKLIKELRLIKPDIVFSSMRSVSAILGLFSFTLPTNTKLVFRENNTPSVSIAESRFPLIWQIIYKTIFRKASTIVCQSDYMLEDFKSTFGFTGENLIKIYNPIDLELINKQIHQKSSPFPKSEFKNVVAIGKMTNQKGFDLLIQSLAESREKDSKIKLWVLGEGKELDNYKRLARILEIEDDVHFVGRQCNPFLWMKHADLFILSSRYEGLPNVLLEALACGCKVVTTDHPGGTREIMEIINCADRIVSLNWSSDWFKPMPINRMKFEDTFHVSKVIKQYEHLFNNLMQSE